MSAPNEEIAIFTPGPPAQLLIGTYVARLEAAGMVFSGRAPHYPIMQVLELPADVHPFFIGTQAHPELTSRPLRPAPLFAGLIEAALATKSNETSRAAQPARSKHA